MKFICDNEKENLMEKLDRGARGKHLSEEFGVRIPTVLYYMT